MRILAAMILAILGLSTLAVAEAIPECPREESTRGVCYWDASQRGNGEGQSFVNIYGVTVYVN